MAQIETSPGDAQPTADGEAYPQEAIINSQKSKQLPKLQQQREHFSFYREEEHLLLNRVLADEDFVQKGHTFEKWLMAGFAPGCSELNVAPCLSNVHSASSWLPASFIPTSFGIQLCGSALKLIRVLSMRAIALEVRVAFRLKGDSTFWVSTRGQGFSDPDAVVCRLHKHAESQRLFLEFGSLVGQTGTFKFFKKQELPARTEATEEALACDYINVKMKFIDNGDGRAFAHVRSSTDHPAKGEAKRYLKSSCNYFVPCLDPTSTTLLGSGESVEVSMVRVKFIERSHAPIETTGRKECCGLM